MTDLVIIRGLPGSGKTTMAKRDFHDYVLCEADQYFGSPYRYNPKKIQQAHGYCFNKARTALGRGQSVVVANTFTRHSEYRSYVELAEQLGIPHKVIVATGNWKSVHDVPEHAIQRMLERWEA